MAIEILLATTPELKDAAYELRYRVFREEQYEIGSETFNLRRFVDFWDTFDTTYTFVAIADGKVVSTLRAVVENALGRRMGDDPASFGVQTLVSAGEPGAAIGSSKKRLEELWGARVHDDFGGTEVAMAPSATPVSTRQARIMARSEST